LKKLLDCGFIVTAMICDPGKNNVAAFFKDLKVTKDKPFVEVNVKKDLPILFFM